MTAQRAGAAPHRKTNWEAIDWQAANQNVRRLQARIVKAQQAGKRGKVKALQRLLTHSYSGKVLAVRRVTENQGKKTAGVDKVHWDTPAKKAAAVDSLRQRGYQARPLRRVYIPKQHDKTKRRALGIPTMADRAMQALYLLALEPIAETTGDPNSYGFRPQRSPADAIAQCFNTLAPGRSPQWIFEGDIRSCFDNISHEWLLTHVPMDKAILHQWLKAGYMDRSILYPTETGTPQGGIASPVLANLALDGLESALLAAFPHKPARGPGAKVNLSRFADDFVITGRSKELLEQEVKPLVQRFLQERGLELSQEKTRITHIEDGFDFLGQNVRKYRDGKQLKLLIKPSPASIRTVLDKARDIIQTHPQLPAGKLVRLLNPLIRGWALYHRHVVSSQVFKSIGRVPVPGPQAMGQAQASKPNEGMGAEEILPQRRRRQLGVLWRGRRPGAEPHPGRLDPHSSSCQDQGNGQPLRPRLGNLLRGTPWGRNGQLPPGSQATSVLMERTERHLSDLPAEDHQDYGMAQPSSHLAVQGRLGPG